MIWFAYVALRKSVGFDCVKHTLFVPNTSRADMRAVCLRVAEKYQVPTDQVLCIPATREK